MKYSREADQDSGPCEFFDLNTFLSKTNIRKAAVFQPKRKNTRINRKTRLSIMGVVALLLGCLLFKKSVDRLEDYSERLNASILDVERKTSALVVVQEDIEELEGILSTLKTRKPIDMYEILSELYSIMPKETRIVSFVVEGESFQLQALGQNPLTLMDRFKDSEILVQTTLVQIVPVVGTDVERFSIKGKVYAD